MPARGPRLRPHPHDHRRAPAADAHRAAPGAGTALLEGLLRTDERGRTRPALGERPPTMGWWRWRRYRRRTAAALLLAAALGALALTHDSHRERERWGERAPVVTVTATLPRGHVLDADDLSVRELPVAAVPRDAVIADGADELVGRRLSGSVAAGEALVAHRVAPGGLVGLAALVPAHARAVAIPVGDAGAGLGVAPGMHVDLVRGPGGVGDPWDERRGQQGPAIVARDVEVLDVAAETVTVLVAEDDAPAVAAAAASGSLVPLLRGS